MAVFIQLITLCQLLILGTADKTETMNCKRHFLWFISVGKFYSSPFLHRTIQELFAGMVSSHMIFYSLILSIATKQSICQHTYLMAISDPQNVLFRPSNREQYVYTEKPFISDTSESILCSEYSKYCSTFLQCKFAINAI
jgi:hypothetical protein